MSTLPQQDTIKQYQADGVEDEFIYTFLIPTNLDIAVYVTPDGEAANPTADIKVLNVDYTVQGAGTVNGGTVTFTTPPDQGSTVTLSRNIQFSIETNFSNAQTISGVNLDNAFQRVTLMAQQLNTFYQLRGLQYIINDYIPQTIQPTLMPILEEGQMWQGSSGGTVIAVTLEENPDWSTLRSELASQVQDGDGARLIGYYDEYNNVGETLADFLNGLPTYIAEVVAGLVPTSGFTTGDVKPSMNPTPLSGWFIWSDGSIGSAVSGATVRANADTQTLFELLWDNCDDTICPVSGGRGISATADFTADKALTLPSIDGRTLVNLSGTYNLGETFGEDEVTLTNSTIPAHHHTEVTCVNSGNFSASGGSFGVFVPGGGNTGTTGSGNPHENRQPSTAVYYHVKL